MGRAESQLAAHRLTARLRELGIPHAIAGGLAVVAHGHLRVTVDVHVILTADDLDRFKQECLGRGWVEQSSDSRSLRDTVHDVRIDVLLAGDYPGDGRAMPVRFPDPRDLGLSEDESPILPLPVLLELKIASGMTAPHRLEDLADVVDLIRTNELPRTHREQLEPYVRDKFDELWELAQVEDGY